MPLPIYEPTAISLQTFQFGQLSLHSLCGLNVAIDSLPTKPTVAIVGNNGHFTPPDQKVEVFHAIGIGCGDKERANQHKKRAARQTVSHRPRSVSGDLPRFLAIVKFFFQPAQVMQYFERPGDDPLKGGPRMDDVFEKGGINRVVFRGL